MHLINKYVLNDNVPDTHIIYWGCCREHISFCSRKVHIPERAELTNEAEADKTKQSE